MITQSIRTSKYTTTIEIPAEKLHTKAKFIQISKSPSHLRQQTITIPNQCYQVQQQSKRLTLQTKLMIEELQQAYNEDVMALQEQIASMKTTHEIQKLKLCNQLTCERREMELTKRQAERSESLLKNSQLQKDSLLAGLQNQVKSKNQVINSQSKQLGLLLNEVKELKKQLSEKNSLLMSKFREIQTDKDKLFREEKKSLEQRIEIMRKQKDSIKYELSSELQRVRDQCRRHLLTIQRLQRQNLSVKEQLIESKKQLQFQTKQIDSYIKNLKQLEQQKALLSDSNINLHQKIEEQNHHIEKLLEEMRQQTLHIENLNMGGNTPLAGGNLRTTDRVFQEELTILRLKLDEYSQIIRSKDLLLSQKETQYLLRLKEIDTQKINTQKVHSQLLNAQTQIATLNQQITQLHKSQEYLKTQLASKIVQYNELLSRPPEHYEVKIQKTIDKKDYINQLQAKIHELQAVIEQLREDNQSYVEEIRKKVKETQLAKIKEQSLIKSNEELRDYISNRQKSLGWAVEREIMKDVSLSQDNQTEKASGYKVFVKHSSAKSSSSNSHIEVSGINAVNAINFSVESHLEKILDKPQRKSQIYVEKYSISKQNHSVNNQSSANQNQQEEEREE